jgi:uncharacterized protein (DUF58 family)
MLTTRGFWFFIVAFALLATAILLGAAQLALICTTLLLWFLAQWFLFQLRLRLAVSRLTVERSIRNTRGEVESVWAGQKIDIAVTLSSSGKLALPYVVVTDRVPALARLQEGAFCLDGALSAESPMTIAYRVECKSAGWLRFEGIKLQLADLQGFFTFATFIHDLREYRVLPTIAAKASHTTFVKQHNILPLLGTHRHARPGGSSELLDLRDYLPGDPPKMIAWKVSARRERLITKELESEVPIRCTLFIDTSNSVRVGPVGETALCRLIDVAAGVAQSNAAERDLTGLCLFDETGVTEYVKPGRGSKHLLQMIGLLTDVAGLIPYSAHAKVRELVPVAFGLAQDLYPDWLDDDVNYFPRWLPFWSPQPNYTIPPGAPRDGSRFSPGYRREYRWRKQLSAILAIRYGLGPGGLAFLLEDDERCVRYLQRFLAEHQVAFPFPLYDHRGDYLFAAPQKPKILADMLLKAITRGKDNELFVLCIDVLENTDNLAPLERAVCVAKARHHQVIVICPWPVGVDTPGTKPSEKSAPFDYQLVLQRLCTKQLQQAFGRVQQAFGRIGVPVFCAAQGDSVSQILHRMRRLRIQERGVR